jgi:chorismate synthase
MKTRLSLLSLLPLALSLACTDPNKVPAEAALQAADAAVSSIGELGQSYAPDQTAELQKSLADAKALAAKKDYKGALAAAQAIPERAKAVVAAASATKDEVQKKQQQAQAWGESAGAVSNLLAALNGRLGELAQAKKLPAGISKDALAQAKTGAAEIASGFEEAKAKATAGDLGAAAAKGAELKAKALEIMKTIGMAQ